MVQKVKPNATKTVFKKREVKHENLIKEQENSLISMKSSKNINIANLAKPDNEEKRK